MVGWESSVPKAGPGSSRREEVSVHTGCSHTRQNCECDEEQTSERGGNGFSQQKKKKTKPDLVYNGCSEV